MTTDLFTVAMGSVKSGPKKPGIAEGAYGFFETDDGPDVFVPGSACVAAGLTQDDAGTTRLYIPRVWKRGPIAFFVFPVDFGWGDFEDLDDFDLGMVLQTETLHRLVFRNTKGLI